MGIPFGTEFGQGSYLRLGWSWGWNLLLKLLLALILV